MVQTRRLDQKQRIRRKAAELFAKNGYEATGVQELSDAVGLGRGALYHHIGSKDELLFDIITRSAIAVVGQAEALLEEDLSAEEKIRRLSHIMMETIVNDLDSWTVFFREIGALKGRLRRESVEWRDRFEGVWTTVIEQGVSNGEFRPLDPVAIKGILGMHNYAWVWVTGRGPKTPEEISAIFCDLILPGLRADVPAKTASGVS